MTMRAGIIGCGNIAGSHAAGYRVNGVAVTAVTDINPDAAAALAAKYDARVFPDAAALFSSGIVDVVSICTPPCAHEEAAVAALQHGLHVLLEKPQAHTLAAAENITRAANGAGALLMMAFRHRFLNANIKFKSIIDSDTIGRPVFFENVFCGPAFTMKDKWFSRKAIAGGGSMLDTSSHAIDLFRFFFGEIATIDGAAASHLPGIEVEDAGIIVVKSADGVIGSLISAWVAGISTAVIRVMGEDGSATYDYTVPDRITVRRRDVAEPEIVAVTPGDGFSAQIAHFLAAIAGREKLGCTAVDGWKNFKAVDDLYRKIN